MQIACQILNIWTLCMNLEITGKNWPHYQKCVDSMELPFQDIEPRYSALQMFKVKEIFSILVNLNFESTTYLPLTFVWIYVLFHDRILVLSSFDMNDNIKMH